MKSKRVCPSAPALTQNTHLLDFFLFLAAQSALASNRWYRRCLCFFSLRSSLPHSSSSTIDDDGREGTDEGQSAYNTYVQYPNASFFRTILHLECDPSFGPGSNKYRLTFDCPRSFSKYAGAGAAKSTRDTSLINRSKKTFSFFRTPPLEESFDGVFFLPSSFPSLSSTTTR